MVDPLFMQKRRLEESGANTWGQQPINQPTPPAAPRGVSGRIGQPGTTPYDGALPMPPVPTPTSAPSRPSRFGMENAAPGSIAPEWSGLMRGIGQTASDAANTVSRVFTRPGAGVSATQQWRQQEAAAYPQETAIPARTQKVQPTRTQPPTSGRINSEEDYNPSAPTNAQLAAEVDKRRTPAPAPAPVAAPSGGESRGAIPIPKAGGNGSGFFSSDEMDAANANVRRFKEGRTGTSSPNIAIDVKGGKTTLSQVGDRGPYDNEAEAKRVRDSIDRATQTYRDMSGKTSRAELLERMKQEGETGRATAANTMRERIQQMANEGALNTGLAVEGVRGANAANLAGLQGEQARKLAQLQSEQAYGLEGYKYGLQDPTRTYDKRAKAMEAYARIGELPKELRADYISAWRAMYPDEARYMLTQRKANGGLIEGYNMGGQIPGQGFGAAPAMPNPLMAKYGQYLTMAKQFGLPPLPLEEFAANMQSAQMAARASQNAVDMLNNPRAQIGQMLANGGLVNQDMYADGGEVDENGVPTNLGQMYPNAGGAAPQQPQQQQPQQTQPQQPHQQPQSWGDRIRSAFFNPESRNGVVQRNGGGEIPDDGEEEYGAIPVAGRKLKGVGAAAGGPREDSIPAIIDGERPAALSSGEYVIPAHIVRKKGTEFFDKLIGKQTQMA